MYFENCLIDLSQNSDLEGYFYRSQTTFQLVNSALKENTPSNCVSKWDKESMNHAVKEFTNVIYNDFTKSFYFN